MNMAFSNARLIDPANGLDELGTLVVEKGKISAIGKNVKVPDKMKSHDCNGMAILPGLVDMQVFTGEPGEEYRETCLLYTSPSPRDLSTSRMPSSA